MRRLLNLILVLSILVFSCWIGGFFYFVKHLSYRADDLETRTDAIVVLTGSACRITEGAHLLAKGYADHLFISGVPEKLSKKVLLLGGNCPSHLNERDLAYLLPKTFVGHEATTTKENALETLGWVQENNIKSIRLVTSFMHLPRSLIEFKRHMPHIKIIPHPVTASAAHHKKWYQNWTVFSKLFWEYNKYLWVHIPWLPKSPTSNESLIKS